MYQDSGCNSSTRRGSAAAAAAAALTAAEAAAVEAAAENANVHPTSISRSNSCGNAAAFHQQPNEQQQQQAQRLSALNADVRLLRTIGYIASRVRCLAKYYGDFHLHNPYSARRQRRQLQEILLKHSIFDPGRERERALLLAAAAVAVGAAATLTTTTLTTTVTRSQSCGSNLGIASCVEQPIDQQQQHRQVLLLNVDSDDEEQQQVQEEELELLIAITTATAATTTATTTNTAATIVRRNKSSNSSASVSAIASAEASGSGSGSGLSSSSDSLAIAATPIALLEELLIQFYEDQDQEQNSSKLTVIRQQLAARSDNLNNNNNGRGSGSNNNNNNNIQEEENGSSRSASTHSLTMSASHSNNMVETTTVATTTTTATATIAVDAPSSSSSRAFLLQPAQDPDTPRRRRASDCSAVQAANQQLHITLKNNNCANKLHRGSCGGAGEHLLAANSIANRATIILSKSCSNVDGDATASLNLSLSSDAGGVAGLNLQLRASATDLESNSNGGGGGGAAAAALNGAREAITSIAAAASNGNGNNEYSILQLNNTIIQCHFNDDDFRALVKDLKRKVEYTERMNWLSTRYSLKTIDGTDQGATIDIIDSTIDIFTALVITNCLGLSNRPLGPPHRKSSLPKHQEVKRRFLEICDTNFSDEVKSALRLPAFDSYEWGDADVIHLMQTMFLELGFIEKFSIPVETLREWLYEVYKHYNEVPFHNFRHCFCVAQMMYAITRQANLLHRLGDLECLILLVSCICHDLDHPGYNNIYQINARTELALRYNDISPLENHHCSIAFRLLEHPECNIFKNFGRETFKLNIARNMLAITEKLT
ncbi:Pde9 [Drosophila busckii]|uniref:Phosphodiesterase n=1 Tax=Drosophila busckii TaxID=30019 RepID=A0A0M4EYY5_DROBS|nr:Pde9 [Drosophila busckii]